MRISECDNIKEEVEPQTLCVINDIAMQLYFHNEDDIIKIMKTHPTNTLREAWIYVNCSKNNRSTSKRKITIIYSTDWTYRTIKMDKVIEAYENYKANETLQLRDSMLAAAMNYLFHYNNYDGIHNINSISIYDLILT